MTVLVIGFIGCSEDDGNDSDNDNEKETIETRLNGVWEIIKVENIENGEILTNKTFGIFAMELYDDGSCIITCLNGYDTPSGLLSTYSITTTDGITTFGSHRFNEKCIEFRYKTAHEANIVEKLTSDELVIRMGDYRFFFQKTTDKNSINIPDAIFKAQLMGYDTNMNGEICLQEAQNIIELLLHTRFQEIKTLKGIEHFINLEGLYCDNHEITDLDLSGLTNLKTVFCSYNQMQSLTVSNCTDLTTLSCYGNQLKTLSVSNCPKLKKLTCGGNEIETLDISTCVKLMDLSCSSNKLQSLDLGNCPDLFYLFCDNNLLSSLDLTKNLSLAALLCTSNPNLTTIYMSSSTYKNMDNKWHTTSPTSEVKHTIAKDDHTNIVRQN